MSDFLTVRQKLTEGLKWRKTIDVSINGEDYSLAIRQLKDEEFLEIYPRIDLEKIQEIVNEDETATKEEDFERLQELRNKEADEELDEDEEQEKAILEEKVEGEEQKLINALDVEAFKAIQEASVYAVVPDGDDIDEVLQMKSSTQKEMFGKTIRTPEQAKEVLTNDMEDLMKNATDLVSFEVGLQAFLETASEKGN